MSTIISSFDKHPVYIDSQGNPLSFGKLYYYAIGTNTPKSIYTDDQLTVTGSNPQLLDASGRTETQIFLGDGQYTVVAWKFNGEDPNTAPDQDWSQDNEWDEEGHEIVDITGLMVTVDTIAELRNTLPTTAVNTQVLGYYAAGDMFVRNYRWDANYAGADNGGTVIKNPLYSVGAWMLQVDGDTLDVRIFGMLPGTNTTYNSQLTSCVSAAQTTSSSIPRTIYFPSGIYKFVPGSHTIQTKVIISKGVYFSTVSNGDLKITLAGDYEIYHTDDIKATSSVGTARFYFTSPTCYNEINVRWFGAKLDGVTDDTIAMGYAVVNTSSDSYTFLIDGPMKYGSSLNRSIYNNIRFAKTGLINISGSGTMTFRRNCELINDTNNGNITRTGVLTGSYSKFIFDTNTVRATLFLDAGNTSTTVALNTIIDSIGAIGNPSFIFDAKTNYFNGFTNRVTCTKFNYVYETGTLTNASPSNVAFLGNLDGANGKINILGAGFGITNTVIQYSWFIPASPTDTQATEAMARAMTCAINGSGQLDLCNRNIRLTSNYSLYGTVVAKRLKVYNGTIVLLNAGTYAINLPSIAGGFESVHLQDLFINGGSSGLISISGTTQVTDLTINNVQCICPSTSNVLINITNGGGLPGELRITHSHLTGRNLIACGLSDRATIDNNTLWCDADLEGFQPSISNNYIRGSNTGKWTVQAMNSALVTGNRFYLCDLYCLDNGGGIDHVVTGNQFESNDTKWSRVVFEAHTASTRIAGAAVTGNSWMGNVTAGFAAIVCTTTGGGSWDTGFVSTDYSGVRYIYQSNHRLIIANNTAISHLIVVPQTEGIFKITPTGGGSYINVDGIKRMRYTIALPPEVFYIPGSWYCLGSNVTCDYGGGVGPGYTFDDASNPYTLALGSSGYYRQDGKFTFSYRTDFAIGPYSLTFSYRIYHSEQIGFLIS